MHKLNPSANGEYFVLCGPYDPDFTEKMKAAVPPQYRQWRPVSKVWRIYAPFDQTVRDLLQKEQGR